MRRFTRPLTPLCSPTSRAERRATVDVLVGSCPSSPEVLRCGCSCDHSSGNRDMDKPTLAPALLAELHVLGHRHWTRLAVFAGLYLVASTGACLLAGTLDDMRAAILIGLPLYVVAGASLHGISLFTHEGVHGTLSRRPGVNRAVSVLCACRFCRTSPLTGCSICGTTTTSASQAIPIITPTIRAGTGCNSRCTGAGCSSAIPCISRRFPCLAFSMAAERTARGLRWNWGFSS